MKTLFGCLVLENTHATAIKVLRESNMNKPSMLAVVPIGSAGNRLASTLLPRRSRLHNDQRWPKAISLD